MNGRERVPVSIGMKLVALLLMIGGVLGVGLTFWLDLSLVSSGRAGVLSPAIAMTGAFIVLFGWAAWVGRELWIGERRALRMAGILFALQLPVLRIPGLIYEWHTGFTVPITVSSGARFGAGLNLGSSFSFYISPQIQDFYVGVNLVAVLVLVFLIRKSREVSAAALPPPPPTPPPPPMPTT